MLSCSKSEDVLETGTEVPEVSEVNVKLKVMTYNIHIHETNDSDHLPVIAG